MIDLDRYKVRSGIDGFYFLYLDGANVFSLHADQIDRAIEADGASGYDCFDDHLLAVLVLSYEVQYDL